VSIKKTKYLGLGKTMFNTGATLLEVDAAGVFCWLTVLSERIERKKFSRSWPLAALKKLPLDGVDPDCIAHNSDIMNPRFKEDLLAKSSPFYEFLRANSLGNCTEKFNSNISYVEHHEAHAFSALAVVPYDKCYVLVMDGGGSKRGDTHFSGQGESEEEIEHTTIYFWDGRVLKPLFKEWLQYKESRHEGLKFSNGIGSLYEKVAELIFKDSMASGKVMGLAGFGTPFKGEEDQTLFDFLESLDWSKRFHGNTKEEWAQDPHLAYWKDLAATAQLLFEENLERVLGEVERNFFDEYGEHPLVMTGGCALNCTANFKVVNSGVFHEVYVSPFPGDESISLGVAVKQAYSRSGLKLQSKSWEIQNSFFGQEVDFSRVPSLFENYEVELIDTYDGVCERLERGEVIGWFQGRSECGPRALGHRSLLGSIAKVDLKNYLNREIKFREDFRPYGASILFEEASEYFEIEKDFQNPFMSFAVPIRKQYRDKLREICHIDGTCRMQTVMKKQNESFYKLLETMKKGSGLPVLLNTSLNIMGEPIVESLEDALAFLEQSRVETMVIGDFLVTKKVSA